MNPEDQRTSCPGFLDEYGVWNNGFECPLLAGKIRICCGSESRRYCCTLDNLPKPVDSTLNRGVESNLDNQFFLSDRKTATFFTLPIFLSCLIGLIVIFLLIFFSLFFWSRCRTRRLKREKQRENLTTKNTLLVDHFPFTPPHHQLFLHENNSPYHQTIKENLTGTTTSTTLAPSSTSSSSGRTASDIYFPDWKDFLIAGEQPMNLYPTMSSYSNELINEPHSNYFFHGKRQSHDVIV